jgi:hypothetical protein
MRRESIMSSVFNARYAEVYEQLIGRWSRRLANRVT